MTDELDFINKELALFIQIMFMVYSCLGANREIIYQIYAMWRIAQDFVDLRLEKFRTGSYAKL